MRGALPLLAATIVLAQPASAGFAMVGRASGDFTVTITPEAADAKPAPRDPEAGLPTSRMGMTKTFRGGMAGTAKGTMLAVGAPGEGFAAYVAVDQFRGTVDGRQGTFVLLHKSSMTGPGDMRLDVAIAPGSGTGALAGITGTLTISIVGSAHRYVLDYRLPSRPR